MSEQEYEDIIHRPRHRSSRRVPMPRWDRAAQFAPFSALAGHEEGATETARTTQSRVELTEDAIAQLDEVLGELRERLEECPQISVTYFVPDGRKMGGEYVTDLGRLKKIDLHRRRLVLADGREISIEEIVDVTCQEG